MAQAMHDERQMNTSGDVVLLTGAMGNVGREVVRALRARNMRVRAADRDPRRVTELFANDVEAVRFDYRDPATFVAADGSRALFLLRPPAIADVQHTLVPFIDESRRRGIRHVVFVSVAGADKNKLVPHHAVERQLSPTSGWPVPGPGFFAQNLGDAYRPDVVEDRRLFVPARRGRVAFVDVRDLADVVATIFASPAKHDHNAYTLPGPRRSTSRRSHLI